jgi:hypothetical protein
MYSPRAMRQPALPFAPEDERPVVLCRRTRASRDAPCAVDGRAMGTFVDLAVSREGRASVDGPTVAEAFEVPPLIVPVLTHAGPMAGAFLVERPVAASDVVTFFGRRPHALDEEGWRTVLGQFVDARRVLVARGATAVVLSIDSCGLLASALSPRTNPLSREAERIDRVSSFAHALADGPVPLGIALTVEERMPGGIDARLGIDTARACVAAGATFIIAGIATGSIDREAPVLVDTGDPVNASAAWLVGRVDVPVFASGTTTDVARAAHRARAFGLVGFVDVDEAALAPARGHV